ncbi:MAG TPA: DUF2179 domain-containing protein [Treponemataceae bacterium]|nr:DUF2179 domain-containing protein [Treponemataceae bacterium]
MFDSSQLMLALIIFVARVSDVSLGTFRHVMVIRGKKLPAFFISFVEALIWVYAVSQVISKVTAPLTAFAFALGFATGTFVGITVENFFKIGEQVVRVFSTEGNLLSEALREKGYRVTVFDGTGRNGVVQLLFVQARRREVAKISAIVRSLDPKSFLIVDDIRTSSVGNPAPGK